MLAGLQKKSPARIAGLSLRRTGLPVRRQTHHETPSRTVGFCVENSTGAGRAWWIRSPALPEIGARLALTRWALDLTRFQMARLLGTDTSTWGTYEAGLQRIPANQALKLSACGIPLDWIYDGKVANLHPHIRDKIRELTKREKRGGH